MINKPSTKINVIHFLRKPRPGFNFSIETIFADLRNRLKDRVNFTICTSSWFNDRYWSKWLNITEAAFRQKKEAILHVTGEVNFLDLLLKKKQVVLTIHDCRYMERKKGLARKLVKWLYLDAPVKKAAWVTTVSETTKQEVIKYTACDPAKIIVIPVPVNPMFKPAPKPFNKTRPVLLQVGAAENKNLSRLIEAIKDFTCRLVIIGQPGDREIQLLKQYQVDHTIKRGLTNEALYMEYINCDIVTFVSTHEGFGMPVAEANSVERAVLTSSVSSMPEIAGDAACLVDPYNVAAIREGLRNLINDDAYRDGLIAKGRLNRERFNGDTIAGAYYAIYKKIAERNNVNG